jgi:hypothetical protein
MCGRYVLETQVESGSSASVTFEFRNGAVAVARYSDADCRGSNRIESIAAEENASAT